MPCIIAVIALLTPRVVLFFIWLLAHQWFEVYQTWYWPLLGFLFMPYTTLAYMAAMVNNGGLVNGWWLVLVIVAAIVDAGHWGGGGRTWRHRHVVIVRE